MSEAPGPAGLDLHQAAGLLGAYCAVERRLFEVTGSMATDASLPPEHQLFLDAMSKQHAWHAELWADRLPVTPAIDAAALVVLPPAVGEVLGAVSERRQPEGLVGLFRVVLPRLVVSYSRHASVVSPVADAPTARALRLVVRDEVEELVGGESLVERLLGVPEAVQLAGRVVVDLEARLVGAGSVPGLVPWPV
ncbi:MAG TPA: hypothetical protein VEJ44_07280 [Acidimicrobiales bacterium]|nr:hypothetical protein [Acidimicrobiales bacterium]